MDLDCSPFIQAFQEIVKSFPDCIAIEVSESISLTYTKLWSDAQEVACRLSKQGVKRGQVVAVLFGRSVQ